jgi:peptidoglycan L-alanyl-D-glutamate endopeptidase CwlK
VTFALGPTSLRNLGGVHPILEALVKRAIEITTQDFTVTCGVRTLADEEAAVAAGRSKTLNSKHLVQPDGYGHAVDLVPWENGAATWDWPLIYPIAAAMRQAAAEASVQIIWGGSWDRLMSALPGDPAGLEAAVQAYKSRHAAPVLLDGPHYQLS